MSDFEVVPVGTMEKMKQLQVRMDEGFKVDEEIIDHQRGLIEQLREALEDANSALQQFRGIERGKGWDDALDQLDEAQREIAAALATDGEDFCGWYDTTAKSQGDEVDGS